MASDPSIKEQLLSKLSLQVKSRLSSSLSFRQGATSNQGDGPSPSVKQISAPVSLSRSSTSNLRYENLESKSDHGAGHTGEPSPTPSRTINVVLFGETGVGKSSVINLIAQREVAKVSSDVNGCTMLSTRHNISFDGVDYAIFDTIGLEEPQMGVNGYLKAIERAYELIMKLTAAGGIHLLLFCMRGGRITATAQSNYRLFSECLCNTKVPIALVFTNLEREVKMDDWWNRNRIHIEHYGIKSKGHACITAVQDDIPGEDLKYTESQMKIRELLKVCALKNDAFLPETHSWFAKLGRGLASFIGKHTKPKRKNLMRVLTNRCKLDLDTARKIADMMEKGDTETKDEDLTEQGGEKGPDTGLGPAEPGGTDEQDRDTHEEADSRPSTPQKDLGAEPRAKQEEEGGEKTPDDPHLQIISEAEPRSVRLEDDDKIREADETVAKGYPSGNPQDIVGAELCPIKPERDYVFGNLQNHGEAETPTKQKDKSRVADPDANEKAMKSNPSGNLHHIIKTDHRPGESEGKGVTNEEVAQGHLSRPGGKDKLEVADGKAAKGHPSGNSQNIAKGEARPIRPERWDEFEAANEKTAKNHPSGNSHSTAKAEALPVRLEMWDEFEAANEKTAKGHPSGNSRSTAKAEARPVKPEKWDEFEAVDEKTAKGHPSRNSRSTAKAEARPVKPERWDEFEAADEKTAKGRPMESSPNLVDALPRPKDVSGFTSQRAAKDRALAYEVEPEARYIKLDQTRITTDKGTSGHTLATPQTVVQAKTHTVGPDKGRSTSEKTTEGRHLAKPWDDGVDAESRSVRPERKEKRGDTNEGTLTVPKDGRRSGVPGTSVGMDPQVRSRRDNMQPGIPPMLASSGLSRQPAMPGGFPSPA